MNPFLFSCFALEALRYAFFGIFKLLFCDFALHCQETRSFVLNNFFFAVIKRLLYCFYKNAIEFVNRRSSDRGFSRWSFPHLQYGSKSRVARVNFTECQTMIHILWIFTDLVAEVIGQEEHIRVWNRLLWVQSPASLQVPLLHRL